MATRYRILVRRNDGLLAVIGDVESHGPTGAVRSLVTDPEDVGDYGYVAVPVTNWTEVGIQVEQPPPRLVVSDTTPSAAPADPPPADVGVLDQDTLTAMGDEIAEALAPTAEEDGA